MRISNALSEKVINLARELNYVPNQLAKSLRTGKSHLIGLIVEDISNPFFAGVARLIEEKADAKGYKIIYCSSNNDVKKTAELIKVFRERQVDGYIITPSPGIENDLQALQQHHLPLVLVDRYLPELNTNYVGVDNKEGTYHAICHLVDQGYQDIGFVTLNTKQPQMLERLAGYEKATREHSLKKWIKKVNYKNSHEQITKEIASYISSNEQLDAIFFATNYLGISGLEAIRTLRLRIPGDIAVISFDDHDLFRLYSPSITVVAQPVEQLSRKSIEVVLNDIEHEQERVKIKKFILPTSLIVRESSLQKEPEYSK